jgi:hypothetical protein
MLSNIAHFSLLTILCKIGYMFFPSQVHIFFLGRIANFFSVCTWKHGLDPTFRAACHFLCLAATDVGPIGLRRNSHTRISIDHPVWNQPWLTNRGEGAWYPCLPESENNDLLHQHNWDR